LKAGVGVVFVGSEDTIQRSGKAGVIGSEEFSQVGPANVDQAAISYVVSHYAPHPVGVADASRATTTRIESPTPSVDNYPLPADLSRVRLAKFYYDWTRRIIRNASHTVTEPIQYQDHKRRHRQNCTHELKMTP
jgi:hypothetical protein